MGLALAHPELSQRNSGVVGLMGWVQIAVPVNTGKLAGKIERMLVGLLQSLLVGQTVLRFGELVWRVCAPGVSFQTADCRQRLRKAISPDLRAELENFARDQLRCFSSNATAPNKSCLIFGRFPLILMIRSISERSMVFRIAGSMTRLVSWLYRRGSVVRACLQ